MPITDLYRDYGIETAFQGHKHHREGWINCPCPHCTGSEGFHLGFNEEDSYYYCWRCGYHSIPGTIKELLNISFRQAKSIMNDYDIVVGHKTFNDTNKAIRIGKRKFMYPSGVTDMETRHRKYLAKRGFDPKYIEQKFHVHGTSFDSILDGISYKYRILIPIYWKGQEVSFQCRDYTEKQALKYLACPMEREIVHHKHILYGLEPPVSRKGIIVEGALDVWRLRGKAWATLGTGYTHEQMIVISQLFDEVFVMFDPEKQAAREAEKLVKELQMRGVKSHNYKDLETDPGDMDQGDADYLLKELL